MHDPVGRLDGLTSERPELAEILHLTEDSYSIAAAFGEPARTRWLTAAQAADTGMFSGRGMYDDVLLIPLVEQGQLVGYVALAGPSFLMAEQANIELLDGFGGMFSRCLRRTAYIQEVGGLMVLDPATRVPNRSGFERPLIREIDRARRSGKPVALVVFTLCGLEKMSNLSQSHVQSTLLKRIAGLIEDSLRASDSMGRLTFKCFGVLVADAPSSTVKDIAGRLQHKLAGEMMDDGLGGSFEVIPNAAFVSLEQDSFPQKSAAELATLMIEASVSASECRDHSDPMLVEAHISEE